ncbi:MAG: DUF4327 family protein [Cyanobacteria bacterium P01_G01_bin.67]
MTVATPYHSISPSYSIDTLRDEARQLIETGIICRQQAIYTLCKYIPAREWVTVECELERCDYLLRDPIGDLVSYDSWEND